MYRLINEHADAGVKALDSIGDIEQYRGLRRDLVADSRNVQQPAFQRAYRQYWRMNAARLDEDFYHRYFRLLAETQSSGVADIKAIATELSRHASRDGLQFSFATKLAHMVDPRIPVYDSFVAAFYFYLPPSSTKSKSERLTDLFAFHGFLVREYDRIISKGLLGPSIARLRATRGLDKTVPDQRVIDWLLWSWVSLLRKGSQPSGTALYD
jgi:hypothetical protein